MDKILRINMGPGKEPSYTIEPIGDFKGLGGRGLTSAIISSQVPPSCHALGEDNKLVIAPGLLGGTTGAMSGRASVGCKSPLTGGIKEANAGGQPAQMLARLGYAAVVLEGKPAEDKLYKIHISSSGVEITPDPDLKMKGNYDTVEKMKNEFGDKVGCISIGQAGEMKLLSSTVAFTDMEQRPARHAARGGVGAVMGAKGVKVIVIDDTGQSTRSPKDPEKFKAANRLFVDGLKKHPVTGEGLPAYGTNVLTNVVNEAGGYPTYNFKTGRFKNAAAISGEMQAQMMSSRGGQPTHGCHRGCVIRCSGIWHDKDGHYLTKQPEYETVWSHGGNCGIDDLDAIAMLDRLDDDYGIDTIEMGATIGVAMEAGLAEFGDAEAAINFVHEVGKGSPLGRILGSGAGVTGKVFGVERIPVVKNQAMPAYDPRAVQGMGVTYATSTMGADHTAGYAVTANLLGVGGTVDPLSGEGQVELSRNLQYATAAVDSTGMCLFIAFAILDQPETFQAMLDMINSFHGLEMTGDDFAALGKKITKMERDFNIQAGFSNKDDRLPDYFHKESLEPHNVTFKVSDDELDSVFSELS